MRRNSERILITHVGSLPRPPALADMLVRQERGEAVDVALLLAQARAAVRDVVERQVAAGIDIINDGEQPRVGFQTYVPSRMRGFRRRVPAPGAARPGRISRASGDDGAAFPRHGEDLQRPPSGFRGSLR